MAFVKLADRLANNAIPLLICGPILRRVTSSAVTVWLVTRESAAVTLTVTQAGSTSALLTSSGVNQGKTIGVGSNLHIVAVTARGAAGTLKEGVVYTYNLSFAFVQSGTKSLADAAGVAPALAEFVYAPYTLPSFVLPPSDLQKLRIMHGSCRKPNGGGADALAILNDLIASTASNASGRPHQLFMTGDQIYADEVADILLFMLIDASDTLLGWTEMLPAQPYDFDKRLNTSDKSSVLLPGTRQYIIQAAGFTTDDTRSHLMALGEYLTMYLFAWSPVLWPATLPVSGDLTIPPRGGAAPFALGGFNDGSTGTPPLWDKQQVTVQNYADALPDVRRALANIPSYMICDDHEITDDWNMTRDFCERVYGTPLGLRVVQNGLTAYAVCQAWGNTPEQFEDEAQPPPDRGKTAGRQLLELLDNTDAASYGINAAKMQPLVAVHDAATLAAQAPKPTDSYGVYHDPGRQSGLFGYMVNDTSLNYYYSVEGPSHQVIVTDTRTSRSWSTPGKMVHPDLLAEDDMAYQIDQAPDLKGRLQLVIVTTNMPPIPPFRVAESVLPQVDSSKIYGSDLYDSWKVPGASFDRMVLHLTNRLPLTGTTRTGIVIVLSGDVHTSFASRYQYWATKRFDDSTATANGGSAVFAQLVASPFKNESVDTRGQHTDGYGYIPKDLGFAAHSFAWLLLPDEKPDGIYGWAVTAGSTGTTVGTTSFNNGPFEDFVVTHAMPAAAFSNMQYSHFERSRVTKLSVQPDYQYRTEQIYTAATGSVAAPSPQIAAVGASSSAADRATALAAYDKAMTAYRDYKNTKGKGKAIVGRSNICEITFSWGSGDAKTAHQTVRWYETNPADSETIDKSALLWARYDVSLALSDTKNYGKLPYPPP